MTLPDLAATSIARAARHERARAAPRSIARWTWRATWLAGWLPLATAGLVLLPADRAWAEAPPTCASVSADLDALNTRLVARSERMIGAMQGMMAAQEEQRTAMEARKNAGAAAGIAGALLGSIIPGGQVIGAALARTSSPPRVAANDAPRTDLIEALEATSTQGEDAARAGALMSELQRLGC